MRYAPIDADYVGFTGASFTNPSRFNPAELNLGLPASYSVSTVCTIREEACGPSILGMDQEKYMIIGGVKCAREILQKLDAYSISKMFKFEI